MEQIPNQKSVYSKLEESLEAQDEVQRSYTSSTLVYPIVTINISIIARSNMQKPDFNQIVNLLKNKKEFLFHAYSVKSMALFGSFVRGDNDENSDLDILIEFQKPIGLEIVDLKIFLEEMLQVKIDIVSTKNADPDFYQMIKKDLQYV